MSNTGFWVGRNGVEQAPRNSTAAIQLANLNWQANAVNLWDLEPQLAYLKDKYPGIDKHKFVVRSDTNNCLGVVRRRFVPFQNSDLLKFFDPLIQDGDVELDSAGSFNGGERVFALARIKTAVADVVQNDPVMGYLLAANAHNGTRTINVGFTTIRVSCQNSLNSAIQQGKRNNLLIRAYHRSNVIETVNRIRDFIDFSQRTFTLSVEQFRSMAVTPIDLETLKTFVRQTLRPTSPSDEDGKEKKEPRGLSKIIGLFESGRGIVDNAPSQGTVWTAYNAVTEYVDHYMGREQNRLSNSWFGRGAEMRARAYNQALELVQV